MRAAFPDLEVERLIGRGGMGAVFKARQKRLQRTVAIKVVARALGEDSDFAARFLREARALAKLSHPGIVAVHDFGQSDGFFFLVMEYVDGPDLRHLLRQGLVQPRQALAITRDLCDALQYAHDEGVVHRDIKPENVLLDARGRTKIADFGLAKLVHQGTESFLSRVDQVMGTPHYMAPEQFERPREVDHRADLFALGVVLYEMLTGSLPRGNFERPSHRIQVDVRLDEIVLKALQREPELRYQQALEVKTDVDLVSVGTEAGRERAPKVVTEVRRPAAARKDWLRGPRVLAPFCLLWIALAGAWNLGAFPFLMALLPAILVLGAALRIRLRADPELSAAIDESPFAHGALRWSVAVAAAVIGLLAIVMGHVLHWERGTRHWQASHSGILGCFESWKQDLTSLLSLAGGPSEYVQPTLSLERSFTQSSADAASLSRWLLIGVGFLLLAGGMSVAVRVRASEDLTKRSRSIGPELASYALGALVILWVGAPIAALRGETVFEGVEERVDSPLPLEAAAAKLYRAFLEEGFQVEVEQRLRLSDSRSGIPETQVRIYRAQASSPFERWSTSLAGPIRDTPQIWATLAEHVSSVGSSILVRGGRYDATSDEVVGAREMVSRIREELVLP